MNDSYMNDIETNNLISLITPSQAIEQPSCSYEIVQKSPDFMQYSYFNESTFPRRVTNPS